MQAGASKDGWLRPTLKQRIYCTHPSELRRAVFATKHAPSIMRNVAAVKAWTAAQNRATEAKLQADQNQMRACIMKGSAVLTSIVVFFAVSLQ